MQAQTPMKMPIKMATANSRANQPDLLAFALGQVAGLLVMSCQLAGNQTGDKWLFKRSTSLYSSVRSKSNGSRPTVHLSILARML